MNKPIQVLTLTAAVGFCGAADAAYYLKASAVPTLSICATTGDPYCTAGQRVSMPGVYNNTTAGTAAASYSYIDPALGTVNSTSGSAFAQFGVLRAASETYVSSAPPLGSSNQPYLRALGTWATASFQDDITITPTNSALMGQAGTFTASFIVSGSMTGAGFNGKGASTMAFESWRMGIVAGNSYFGGTSFLTNGFYGSALHDSAGVTTTGGMNPGGTVVFTAPIVFGRSFSLSADFMAQSYAVINAAVAKPLIDGLTTATSASQYMNTALWQGISSVKYGQQTITDFNVTSGTGVNYVIPAAVPVPAAVWLFGSGLLGLIGVARRKQVLI